MALPKSAETKTYSLVETDIVTKKETKIVTAVNFSDLYRALNMKKKLFEDADEIAGFKANASVTV